MCGIVGVIGPGARRFSGAVERAACALDHRGPDGRDLFVGDDVVLGHTRLAIIDRTARSDQPMVDSPTGAVLVFNGEIYNYKELRRDLEARGHRFTSEGDTEVLLRGFVEWGEGVVDRLNGMFAFAIWDPRRRGVFVARDRFGEKPFHLARANGLVWFASEVKSLLAAGAVEPRPHLDYLFGFLATGDLGHPTRTAFRDVEQLPPAHAGWLDGSSLSTRRYWSPRPTDPAVASTEDIRERFANLFREAVELRLRSDVPVGTSLSGGIDSTTLLATVRHLEPAHTLHAFTASFPGSAADELEEARAVANRLGATIHPVPLRGSDLADGLDRMVRANEAPVESASTFAQFKVMEEANRAGIVVLLDGQGADETWLGYPKYAGLRAMDLALSGHPRSAARLVRELRAGGGRVAIPVARYGGFVVGERSRRTLGRIAVEGSGRWLARSFRAEHARRGLLADAGPRVPIGEMGTAAAAADLHRVTLPRLLRYADRNSMAWSREVRLPYLDHRLVELAMAAPFDSKVHEGWTKYPVRSLLASYGFENIAWMRQKKAYMPPQDEWMQEPAIVDRVATAWQELYEAGVLARKLPAETTILRWRVLVTSAWMAEFAIRL
ncbi:MAG TPA: asparagine synthase (glutamine-hydrolyzing) [Acidimicrobiales bacterium]|jgi:asparagine synthase (glutamine-hydrolysing)|nr:asparagine synthase (glutamine-hydrolyzing) [Acidimicrobiales bacterium]